MRTVKPARKTKGGLSCEASLGVDVVSEPGMILFQEESFRIIGACFEVYKELGCGFLEAVYHEALELEFLERRIPFVARMPLTITYHDCRLRQGYAVDFFLFDKIVLGSCPRKWCTSSFPSPVL